MVLKYKRLFYSEIFVSVDPIENPKMIKLIKRHGYEVISEPYIKKAVFLIVMVCLTIKSIQGLI